MILTKKYINSHRTDKGGITKAQVEALGLKWTPPAGWVKRLVGTEISDEQARKFEEGKLIKVKASINKVFSSFVGTIEDLSDDKFKQLMAIMNTDLERRVKRGMSKRK
jgi:hypothetical protein